MAKEVVITVHINRGSDPFIDGYGTKKQIRKARKRWRRQNPIFNSTNRRIYKDYFSRVTDVVRADAHRSLDESLDLLAEAMQQEMSDGV